MRLLAIDPGLKGGLAYFTDGRLASTVHMPLAKIALSPSGKPRPLVDVIELVRRLELHAIDEIVTEYQTAMPGQSSVATATSFLNWGLILGLRARCPVHIIHPRVWKRELHLGNDKQAAIAKAIHLFPILGTYPAKEGECEAVLIGYYWLQKGQGIAQAAAIKANLPKRRKKAKARRLRKSGRGDAPSPAVRTV